MKQHLLLLLAVLTIGVHAAEVAIGERIPGSALQDWKAQNTEVTIRDGAAVIPASARGFCRVTATLPPDALNKCFELTVNAAATTSSAQVIMTEGFVWGSSQKVKRLFRLRLTKGNEYAEYKLQFRVEQLPFYLNIGILPEKKGEIRVAWLELKEISESELDFHAAQNVEFPRDMNRCEMFTLALKRYHEAQNNPALPPEFRLAPPDFSIVNTEESLAEADKILGELEKIVLIAADGSVNPPHLKAQNGVLRFHLLNRHAPHSVWARLELSDQAEYRLVTPDGEKYLLNQGDLAPLPAGEPILIEISNITAKGALKVYPLDHFSSDCWNIIEVDL